MPPTKTFKVVYMARPGGSIGVFRWAARTVQIKTKDVFDVRAKAANVVFDQLHDEGYEINHLVSCEVEE